MIILQLIGVVLLMAAMAIFVTFIISLISKPMNIKVKTSHYSNETIPHISLNDLKPSLIRERKKEQEQAKQILSPILKIAIELVQNHDIYKHLKSNTIEHYYDTIKVKGNDLKLITEWNKLNKHFDDKSIDKEVLESLRLDLFIACLSDDSRYGDYNSFKFYDISLKSHLNNSLKT